MQARQRATENEKKALQTREILASIETVSYTHTHTRTHTRTRPHTQAAVSAYIKDLDGGAPADACPALPSTVTTPITAPLNPALEENFQLKKAKAHTDILNAIQQRQVKSEREVEMKPPPPPPSQWQQVATADGQFYYFNIFTRGWSHTHTH